MAGVCKGRGGVGRGVGCVVCVLYVHVCDCMDAYVQVSYNVM